MLHSIRWEKIPSSGKRSYQPNILHVKVTFLDESGQLVQIIRTYEQWIGVCTNNIDKVIRALEHHFPDCKPIRYTYVGLTRKILPYFEARLAKNRLDSPQKHFYKVYLQTCSHDIGRFFNKYKICYYDKADWLVRLYIDLCLKYQTQGFYYKWYTIHDKEDLVDSLEMHPDQTHAPDWTIGAFDLETVPMDGADRVPTGLDETDEIVMISLYKWNRRQGLRSWLLYRLPCEAPPLEMDRAHAYTSERQLLNDFHVLIQDCQVLTGYNINGFDLPCLFTRLLWLQMYSILRHYSSLLVGTTLVTTFQNKMVLDLYFYFRIFSSYDLPGFKLDDVARMKLNEAKVPVQSTGLWSWYTHPQVTAQLLQHTSAEACYTLLKPRGVRPNQFGTFKEYMQYCLKDSFLVYRLFEKEMVLSFLVERANFTAWNAVQALHMGNSSFLLELFKTYGTCLGFFVNTHFLKSPIDIQKYASVLVTKNQTYQGALNYCIPEKAYENVSVMDFASMYPSALLSSNLCYGTCTIMTREEWLACAPAQQLTSIAYRVHGERDFENDTFGESPVFRYPTFNPEKDAFAIVINEQTEAFLPHIVKHFIDLRKHHQGQYKQTKDVYHYNAQLCIKILINSLYGVMANKDSCLAYLPIAMTIVTLARYQLLSSYHYLNRLKYHICYADTDSLMVQHWPHNDCHAVNAYLNLKHVELKFEQRMKRLLVLSRKRYIYETQKGTIVTKGFQKRINELIEFISQLVLENVWHFMFSTPLEKESFAWREDYLSLSSRGWILWVYIIQEAHYKCRDAKKYSIYRKTKHLSDYKSKSCVAVHVLQKYPEKANDFIEYTYSRADVSQREASKWVMDAQECQWVNYEQLFMSQKKMFCMLLNMAFWKLPEVPLDMCDKVLNTQRWKQFVQAELLFWHKTRAQGNPRKIVMLVEKGVKYTFSLNDHIKRSRGRNVRLPPNKKQKVIH